MLTRREFLSLCMTATTTLGLVELLGPIMREAYAAKNVIKPPVIWLELGSCTGNSVSLDNAKSPTVIQLLHDMLDFRYSWLLQAVEGEMAVKALFDTMEQEAGNYWLVVEGAVMTGADGRYNYVFYHNGAMVTGLSALTMLAAKAKYIIAVGSCASFGGPSAAHPNPAGAKGVWEVVKNTPVINIPGCPAHPDWMTGTFSHLALYGMPELDAYNRPKMFFGKTIHDLCQRRQQFEDGIFAVFPGGEGCLFKVGCKGPVTHADCPVRQWNHYVNWPVKAGAPCIGCASPQFPDGMMPFYDHLPDLYTGAVTVNAKRIGKYAAMAGVGAVAAHLGVGVLTKRIHRNLINGTRPRKAAPPENRAQLERDIEDLQKEQQTQIETMPTRPKRKRPETWLRRMIRLSLGRKDGDDQ